VCFSHRALVSAAGRKLERKVGAAREEADAGTELEEEEEEEEEEESGVNEKARILDKAKPRRAGPATLADDRRGENGLVGGAWSRGPRDPGW
jgi:hypothetical protein